MVTAEDDTHTSPSIFDFFSIAFFVVRFDPLQMLIFLDVALFSRLVEQFRFLFHI